MKYGLHMQRIVTTAITYYKINTKKDLLNRICYTPLDWIKPFQRRRGLLLVAMNDRTIISSSLSIPPVHSLPILAPVRTSFTQDIVCSVMATAVHRWATTRISSRPVVRFTWKQRVPLRIAVSIHMLNGSIKLF